MRRILVDAIEDGMVLAQPVEDRLGRVLLGRGDTLQARYRERLKEWGITVVLTEGDEAVLSHPAAPATAPAGPGNLSKRVEARFADFDASHALMSGIRLLTLKHLTAKEGK